jgi:peroxiredoxin
VQQVVDLQNHREFQKLGVALLSISPDPIDAWVEEAAEFGIRTPVLSDNGNLVANKYGVMRWQMPTGEPGHTFVLVGSDGRIQWIRDYGAPENGGLMYVLPDQLLQELKPQLRP